MFPKCLRLNFGNQFFRPEKPKFSVFCPFLQMKQTSKNENFCLPDKQKRLLSTSAPQRYLLEKLCFLILFKVVQHLIKQIFRSLFTKKYIFFFPIPQPIKSIGFTGFTGPSLVCVVFSGSEVYKNSRNVKSKS